MMGKWLVVLIAVFSGCKTRSLNANVKEQLPSTVVTLTKDLTLYHYTTASLARANTPEYVRRTVAESRMNDDKPLTELPELAAMGYGFYVVDEPFSSRQFGSTLVAVTLKAGAKIVFSEASFAKEIPELFKSDVDTLGYAWGSLSERAAVVRVGKDLDSAKATHIDCSLKPTPLSKRDMANPSIEKFCDVFFAATAAIRLDATAGKVVVDNKLTEWGEALMTIADTLSNPGALARVDSEVVRNKAVLAQTEDCKHTVEVGMENAAELCFMGAALTGMVFAGAGMDFNYEKEPKFIYEAAGILSNVPSTIKASQLNKMLADAWRAKATPEQKSNAVKFLTWLVEQGRIAKQSTFTTLR